MPEVAFPWGSASTSNTRFPHLAMIAARLTAVVVFPTPPFWLATATDLAIWAKPNTLRYLLHQEECFTCPVGACQPNGTRETSDYALFCCAEERNTRRVESAPGVKPGRRRASPKVCGFARSSRSTISFDKPL